MPTKLVSVKLPEGLVKRIKEHARPHQAIAGVIEELLNNADLEKFK